MSLREQVGNLSGTLVSVIRTRLELFALEAAEQKADLLKLLSMLFGALLFATLALLTFSLLIALFFWPTQYRYWAIGTIIVVYAGLAFVLVLSIVKKLQQGTMPFSATIEELGRDVQMLDRLRSNKES